MGNSPTEETWNRENVSMPWDINNAMTQRIKFVIDWLQGNESKAEICRRYGVSRRIGYKWVQRYLDEGPSGLGDRSSAPKLHPNQTPQDAVDRVLEMRREYPLWGAPKLRRKLLERHPDKDCPGESVIGEILRDAGLTRQQKKRRRTPPYSQPLAHARAPNDVVSLDFKGWFRTADGVRIDPLTVIDNASRYLLCCQAVDACDGPNVRAVMDRVFRDYGLPKRIRSDNGAPFASRAIAGLSALSVWWIKLGIEVERIAPASPSQNGRQERFHRTLKQHTANPPCANRRAQQRAFQRFRSEYNDERPHQSLDYHTPASVYEASKRRYPRPLLELEYAHWPARKVGLSGQLYWRGQALFVSEVLGGERVGLKAIDDGVYRLWFGSLELGMFDERRGKIAPCPPGGARPLRGRQGKDGAVAPTGVPG